MHKIVITSPRAPTTRGARPTAGARRSRKPTANVGKPTKSGSARGLEPIISRLVASVDVTPPIGHFATILLKLVERDDKQRLYAWWLVVGRNGEDANTVHYKHTGVDMLRCDVPEGMELSVDAVQPWLEKFWAGQPLEGDGVPGSPGGKGK